MHSLPSSVHSPEPKPGMVFNNWTVIRKLTRRYRRKKNMYACRCSCGAMGMVDGWKLIHRNSSTCRSCSPKHQKRSKAIPDHWQSTHAGSVWNYILKLQREYELPMYKGWVVFADFLTYYCEVTHTSIEVAMELPTNWSYFKFMRIDTSQNHAPRNSTFSRFITERAMHAETLRYWRRLQKRGILSPELNDSYIQFVHSFGTRPYKHTLRRYDRTKLHEPGNSYWQAPG